MPYAAGIRFTKDQFSRYYNPVGITVAVDDFVVVRDTVLNIDRVGFVSILEGRAPIQMGHLPKIIRVATEVEIEEWYDTQIRQKEGMAAARERAEAHNLPVKISSVTFVKERQQVLIHFTSEKRVDFRELVKDLAGQFKARIEMWQIGARQEAGAQNGYGVCGNPLCCGSWLKDFPSISMRYAREQDIIQPPSKLSGPCGKLRCCLRYEHETYLQLAEGVPTQGCTGCSTSGACGVIVDRNLLKATVTMRNESGEYKTMPATEFKADAGQRIGVARGERDRDRDRGRGDRRRRGGAAVVESDDDSDSGDDGDE